MNRAMKSRLVNRIILLLAAVTFTVSGLMAQIPQRPQPQRLVNDMASVFTAEQAGQLESTLVDFSNKTSNQIVILTVNSLEGTDKSQFAYSVGEQWGVGQSKFDNGLVILIKPKTGSERGEAFIATGYGLEGALPDAICKRIVENEMIPAFTDNDYFGGITKALNVILPIAAGEYSSKEYAAKTDKGGFVPAIGIIVFIIIMVVLSALGKKGGGSNNIGGGGRRGPGMLELLLLGSLLSGGCRSSGGFGGGGYGGGGGGFGGFGGGGFGGGGAGGSW